MSQRNGRERAGTASAAALVRLQRVPPALIAVAVGVCVAVTLIVGSRLAALALLPVVALLGWLSYLAWPRLRRPQRALRVAVLAGLLAWCAGTLVG